MSIYDILMLIVLGGAIFFGYWKGFAWQVASLASVIVSYIVASNFHGLVSPYFSLGEPWDKFAAMLVLFLGTSLLVWVAFGYIRNTIEDMKLKGFDQQTGAILGAVKGALLCMVITLFAVTLLPASIQKNVIESRSGHFIARSINQLTMIVPDEYHAVLDGRIETFNQKFVENNLDPTLPLNMDNKREWFGEPRSNTQNPLQGGGQVFEGHAQNNTFGVSDELIQQGIEQGIDAISRGINGNQNR